MPTATGHTQAIRAKKVIGTSVKDEDGDTIGAIEDVVLDKLSNNIMFAIVGFDGVLGIGQKFAPIPWSVLDYDEPQDAYTVRYSKDELKAAPAGSLEELTKGDGAAFRDQGFQFYEVDQYW